jgi:hypothetical protein
MPRFSFTLKKCPFASITVKTFTFSATLCSNLLILPISKYKQLTADVQTLSDSVGTPYSRNLATAESFDKPYSVTEREKWEWAIAEEKRAALRKHEEEQKAETEKSAWVGVIVIILIAALWIWMTSRQPGAGDCPDSLSPTGCVTP